MTTSSEATVRRTKIGIVGAGSVGTSLAYAAMIRGTATDIALYDLNTAKVEAEALDLSHGQMFASDTRVEGSDDVAVLRNSDVVLITAFSPSSFANDIACTSAPLRCTPA